MSLTRIDCAFLAPAAWAEMSACVALNPSVKPGSLVFAGAEAARQGISAQVACKLALEHFVSAVLDEAEKLAPQATGEEDKSTLVLEAAFKNANTSVYSFGHRLAAGGRMAAAVLGLVINETVCAVGRAGPGTAYLFRAGELYPFFERRNLAEGQAAEERLIGAHSIVAVELASVPIQAGDLLVALARTPTTEAEIQLAVLLAEVEAEQPARTSLIVEPQLKRMVARLFGDPEALSFGVLARVGPEAIYLQHVAD